MNLETPQLVGNESMPPFSAISDKIGSNAVVDIHSKINMKDTINYSWQQISEFTDKLVNEIKASGFKPDYLVGITVGGLVPLALMAKGLDINNVTTISANSYDKEKQGKLNITCLPKIDLSGKKVLLVDEIAETGETLKQISDIFINEYKVDTLKTVVVVVNKDKCTFWPDYSAVEVNKWVVFPWEKEGS